MGGEGQEYILYSIWVDALPRNRPGSIWGSSLVLSPLYILCAYVHIYILFARIIKFPIISLYGPEDIIGRFSK